MWAVLISELRSVVVFGVVNVLAISVVAVLTLDGFASVWCGWAAPTSGLIAVSYVSRTTGQGTTISPPGPAVRSTPANQRDCVLEL